MRMREEIGFWLTVMLVAVIGVALFKILGAKVADKVPGIGELAAFL